MAEISAKLTNHNSALSMLFSSLPLERKLWMLAENGISFPTETSCYAAVRIGVQYFQKSNQEHALQTALLDTRIQIRQAMEPALQKICTAYFVVPNSYSLAIILALPKQEMLFNVRDVLIQAVAELETTHHITCFCAVSQPVSSLEVLPLAYQQASDLVDNHREAEGKTCYLASEEYAADKGSAFLDVIRHLAVLLQMHRFSEMPDYLRWQYQAGAMKPTDLRCLYTILENYTLHYLSTSPLQSEALYRLSRLNRFFRISFDLDQWCADIAAFAASLAQADVPKTGTSELGEAIAAYLIAHQSDPTLSLNTIADKFRISVSSASRSFKRYTKLTIVEFLRDTRIAKAKELLGSTDLPIREIAAAVGYTADTLTRVFHRTEQMSPSQYRSTVRQ